MTRPRSGACGAGEGERDGVRSRAKSLTGSDELLVCAFDNPPRPSAVPDKSLTGVHQTGRVQSYYRVFFSMHNIQRSFFIYN